MSSHVLRLNLLVLQLVLQLVTTNLLVLKLVLHLCAVDIVVILIRIITDVLLH